MSQVRYSNIAAKIAGFMAMFWVLGLFVGAYVMSLLDEELSWAIVALAVSFAYVIDFISLRLVLPKACKEQHLCVLKNGEPVTPHGAALFGLAWGLMWRIFTVSIPLNLLHKAVGEMESVFFIDAAISLAGFFFASLWLLKHQLGSTTIERVEKRAGLTYDHQTQELVTREVDTLKTAKEGTTAIFTTVAALSYFAIGFVQLAAIVSFFHDYWGWWYIPSFLVATFVAYTPLVGAVAGIYAAIKIWHWAWYWAGLLFFFPIALGVLVMGAAGFVGLITNKLKR